MTRVTLSIVVVAVLMAGAAWAEAAAPATPRPMPLDEHTVLLYRFDAGQGNKVQDHSATGMDAALQNPPNAPRWVQGILGGALYFDGEYRDADDDKQGDADGVKVPDDGRLGPKEQITLECWFKPERLAGTQYLFSRGAGGRYSLRLNGNAVEWLMYFQAKPPYRSLYSPEGLVKANSWYHVAGSYDGTRMRIHLNGVEVAACEIKLKPRAGGARTFIGRDEDSRPSPSAIRGFRGWIDELRLSNVARSEFPYVPAEMAKPIQAALHPVRKRTSFQGKVHGVQVTVEALELPRIFPEGKKAAGGAVFDPKAQMIYFFGGLSQNRHHIYRINPKTWKAEVLSAKIPAGNFGAYVWDPKAGVAYVMGGCKTSKVDVEGFPVRKVYRFDPTKGAVSEVGSDILPESVYDTCGAWDTVNHVGYILGGYWGGSGPEGGGGRYDNEIVLFDPVAKTAKKIGELPRDGDNSTAVFDPDRQCAYFIGGHAHGKFFNDIIRVNRDGTTRTVGTLPVGLDFCAALYCRGLIFIMGGRNRTLRRGMDAIYSVDPDTGKTARLDIRLPKPVRVQAFATNGSDTVYVLTTDPMRVKFTVVR